MSSVTRPDAPALEEHIQALEIELHLVRTELSRLRVELRAAYAAVESRALHKKDDRRSHSGLGVVHDLIRPAAPHR